MAERYKFDALALSVWEVEWYYDRAVKRYEKEEKVAKEARKK